MSDTTTLKRTPLYDVHRELLARLVPFAGWEMPVQYPSGNPGRAQGGPGARGNF